MFTYVPHWSKQNDFCNSVPPLINKWWFPSICYYLLQFSILIYCSIPSLFCEISIAKDLIFCPSHNGLTSRHLAFLEYLSESRQSRDFRTGLILLWSFEINQTFTCLIISFQMSSSGRDAFSAGFCKKVIEILLNVTNIILYFFSKMTYIKWIWRLCNTKSSQIKPFCLFSCLWHTLNFE